VSDSSDDLDALVGRIGEPFEFVVETGKVREFARATGALDAHPLTDPAPFAPPTFLAAGTLWSPSEMMLLERVGGDRSRMLHGEQEYRFPAGPPRAGARLNALPRVAAAYERAGRRGGRLRFVTIATEYRDEQGGLVAEAFMTVVETERAPEGA